MDRTPDSGMLAIRHAIENASNEPITDAGITAILRGEGGAPSHLRALFGDVSRQSLLNAAAANGIPLATILAAYAAARHTAAAANPELDEALDPNW